MKKRTAFLLFGVAFFFISRFFNLTLLPVFNDESTYIRYGMHQLKEPAHEPYSLRIGKEPLMPFLYAIAGETTGKQLFGARVVTVLFGFITLVGLYMFTKRFTSGQGKYGAFFVCLVYVIAPYTLFFDRLALMDSPVSSVAVWSLYATHAFLEKPTWRNSLLLGLVMGIGLWIKFSALFYVLLPFGVLFFYALKRQKQIAEGTLSLKISIPFVIAFLLFIPLLSHAFYAEHWKLLEQYSYPFSSLFSFQFSVWFSNFSSVFQWLLLYLTPPLFIVSIVSLGLLYKRKHTVLVLWFVIPFLYQVFFAKTYTARHALSLTIPLVIAAGYGWSLLAKKQKIAAYAVVGVILIWSLIHNFFLYTDPQQFPATFPGRAREDMQSYVYGFSSGYGIAEAVADLQHESEKVPITIIIRNDHGNPEDAIVAFLQYKENIDVVPLNNPEVDILEGFKQVQTPIYFVSRGGYYAGMDKYFVSRHEFKKPHDVEFVGVYRLEQK